MVRWAWLTQSVDAENFFVQPHCSKPVPIGQNISFILDPKHSKQPSDVKIFKVPGFRDVRVTLTAPQLHSSSLDSLSSSVCQESKHCYLLPHKRVSIKKLFLLLLNNGFSLFVELLDNLSTNIFWSSEEDPAELCQPLFVDLSNTAWVRKELTKQTGGS